MAMFLIILSIFALAYLPFNELTSIIVALTSVFASAFIMKDNETTKKVLQPTILIGAILSFEMLFNYLILILQKCGMYSTKYYSSDLYDFLNGFSNTINLISVLLTIALVVLVIVLFIAKADVPLVGKLADKIANNKKSSKKEEN